MNPLPLAAKIQSRVHRCVYEPLRRLGNIVVGPINLATCTAHFRSAIRGKPVDTRGEPLPWLSYAAIRTLQELDLNGLKVLEFGAGNSTLFWHANKCHVTSLESDDGWYQYLKRKIVDKDIDLRHVGGGQLINEQLPLAFDIILIDGERRLECVKKVLQDGLMQEAGILILDNSDAEANYPAVKLLERSGFSRIDYYGFAPGASSPLCTSFFFTSLESILFRTGRVPNYKHYV